MSKLLLIHNSDHLQNTLKPKDKSRPLFYWYTDRFASHIGTHKYLYICIVDTDDTSIKLEYRHTNPSFSDLHAKFLEFKSWKEDNPNNLHYAEPGIIMSSSVVKPSIILEADTSNSTLEFLAHKFKVVYPKVVDDLELFEQAYNELYTDNPIAFNQLSSLTLLEPQLTTAYPVINPDNTNTPPTP